MSSAPPDVVYVVREGPNEELRYSLRSLVNLPHSRVFIVGHREPWVKGVTHVLVPDLPDKFKSQRAKLMAAVKQWDLSEDFILMNDDHYVVERLDNLVTYHRGRWGSSGIQPFTSWWVTLRATCQWMAEQGHPNPRTYECHTPLLFNKTRLREVLNSYPPGEPFAVGMTYELTGAGGQGAWGPDMKCRDTQAFDALVDRVPYLSSSDESFIRTPIAEYLIRLFPEPGKYERS